MFKLRLYSQFVIQRSGCKDIRMRKVVFFPLKKMYLKNLFLVGSNMKADIEKLTNENKKKVNEHTASGRKSLNIHDKEANNREYKKEKEKAEKENNVEKFEKKVSNIR